MKIIKRGLCALLITLLIIGITGCGKANSGGKSASSEGGEITLRILENDTAKSEGYLDELLNAFNEAFKDKGIKAVDANMEEYSNLAENGPYGYGPDVLYQANDLLMSYAQDKHILALDKNDYECAKQKPSRNHMYRRFSTSGSFAAQNSNCSTLTPLPKLKKS